MPFIELTRGDWHPVTILAERRVKFGRRKMPQWDVQLEDGRIFRNCHQDVIHMGPTAPVWFDRSVVDAAACQGDLPITKLEESRG